MKHAIQRNFPFDTRSVMLIAALAMGGVSAYAQTANPAPKTQSSPFTAGPGTTAPSASAPSATSAAFDRADANRDGQLNAKEAQQLPAIGNRFEQLDKNRDGLLSREEFNEGTKS